MLGFTSSIPLFRDCGDTGLSFGFSDGGGVLSPARHGNAHTPPTVAQRWGQRCVWAAAKRRMQQCKDAVRDTAMLQSSSRQRPEPEFPDLPCDNVGDTLLGLVDRPAGDPLMLCCPEHLLCHDLLPAGQHGADQFRCHGCLRFCCDTTEEFLRGDSVVAIQPAESFLVTQTKGQGFSLRCQGGSRRRSSKPPCCSTAVSISAR